MFIVEVVTGVLLLFHYVPTAQGAYPSLHAITHVAPFGFFVRNLHYWCGQVMVILVVGHLCRVLLTGSFSPPRHMNWLIGMSLLPATLIIDFTGYLLVWDGRALWAWTIAHNLAQTIPGIGSGLADLLFGPAPPADAALIRVYVWHVVLLPAIMGVLMSWHFWRVRRDGGISRPL